MSAFAELARPHPVVMLSPEARVRLLVEQLGRTESAIVYHDLVSRVNELLMQDMGEDPGLLVSVLQAAVLNTKHRLEAPSPREDFAKDCDNPPKSPCPSCGGEKLKQQAFCSPCWEKRSRGYE